MLRALAKGFSDKNLICDDWRFAAGLYNILKHELGDSMQLLIKLLFLNLNTFDLIKFMANAPEFLTMVRSCKREFFLDAYKTGQTQVILGAVKILDLQVTEMTPPRG